MYVYRAVGATTVKTVALFQRLINYSSHNNYYARTTELVTINAQNLPCTRCRYRYSYTIVRRVYIGA